jgi:light-regulated signal transduction histidine kinase (bacteriophytochrome)
MKDDGEDARRELEALAYAVSHDLKAPLRSIDGFSRVLSEEYGDKLDARGRDYVAHLRAASDRMGRLINGLLALSRAARTRMTPTSLDLSAMAREIAGQQYPAAQISVQDGMTACGDPALVRQALTCLIDNAVKFTGRTAEPRVEVGLGASRGRGACFVRDNGAGFDMARAGRLFCLFQRLHTVTDFPGDGTGLAIVQRIVRRHGGDVWAEARPGEGATFWFTLGSAESP